ncbi:MAG: thiamine pyrophosphate-binding protein [Pyrinomonadaceae bacterium]
MKVSDYIAKFLSEKGVSFVFELSGGMITHMLDSINRAGAPRIVSVHHEQAAAFAADAVGRMTGIPGVAMATSGPGATNLLTGIGSCYFDSSPTVFITGQVNRSEQKGERQIRQLGFQETDIVNMARPITKESVMVQTPDEVPHLLHRAFNVALSGRPGPVLLDIPMDVQRAEIEVASNESASPSSYSTELDEVTWGEFYRQLKLSTRPLILAGGGVRSSGATELLRRFVSKTRIPVVSSLMGVDVLPFSDPLRIGLIGSYGNRWANLTIGRADLLVVLGSRLDIRQTGSETAAFKGERTIFHVDCEPGEVNNRVTGCHAIISDLRDFLREAVARVDENQFEERRHWLAEIAELKQTWTDLKELPDISGINPNKFMHQLSSVSTEAAAYIVDVGQHQMWAAQSLEIGAKQRFLTSGGMGSMGFALPAAIGAALTVEPQPVVVIAGDGGFQSNIQELQTIVRNRLPIKVIIMNNGCHGMVRQFQQSYFEGRYQSTLWGYSAPDFGRVSAAYGISELTIERESQIEDAMQWLWQYPSEPALLQVMIDVYTNVYPKIAFGHPITEMEPFAIARDMEGT